MASTTKNKEPRPWHTKAFHSARFCMTLWFILLVVSQSNEIGKLNPFVCAASALALLDATAVSAWQKGGIVLPLMVRDGSKQSKRLFETLVVSSLAMAIALLLTAVFTVNYIRDLQPEHRIVCWFIVALANCSGWYTANWLREASAIMQQSDEVTVSAEEVVPIALLGLPFTAVSQPMIQPQALRLRVGNGGKL